MRRFAYFGHGSELEELLQLVFLQIGSDHAQTAGILRCALADVCFFRNHVKINPLSVGSLYHALCTQNCSIGIVRGKSLKNPADLIAGVLPDRLLPPAGEDLISIVMMMVVMAASAVIMMVLMTLLIMIMVVITVVMLILVVIAMMVPAVVMLIPVVIAMMVPAVVMLILVVIAMMVPAVVMFIFVVIVMMMLVLLFVLVIILNE